MVEPIAAPATPQAPEAVAEPTPTPTPETPAVPETPETPEAEEPTLLGKDPKEPAAKADEPTGDEPKETPGEAPESYDFKLAEGVELDKATLDLFAPVFKELGLDNSKAQKLVDTYVPVIQGMEERIKQDSINDYKEIVKGWKADTLKQLGEDSDKKMAVCARAINKFGDDNFRAALDQTGLGNHPDFVKFMIKVGETVTEDPLTDPVNTNMPGQTDQGKLNLLYPTMKDK